MVSHTVSSDSSQESCEGYAWYENYSMGGGQTYTGCYNIVSHQTTDDDQPTCEAYGWQANYYSDMIVAMFDLTNDGDASADYEADIRAWLQPAWDHYGITAEDIGTLQ